MPLPGLLLRGPNCCFGHPPRRNCVNFNRMCCCRRSSAEATLFQNPPKTGTKSFTAARVTAAAAAARVTISGGEPRQGWPVQSGGYFAAALTTNNLHRRSSANSTPLPTHSRSTNRGPPDS